MRETALAPSKAGWLIALSLAVLLHMSLAVAAFWIPVQTPQDQARTAGAGGIEISLGSAGQISSGTESQQREITPERPTKPEPKLKPITEPQPSPAKNTTPPPTASVSEMGGKSGDDTAGGRLPSSTQDYAVTLLAWLEQHKEYPRRARMRRQQGTALLHFVVDRQGQVLSHRIHQSSGYSALDEEVLDMIQRAQPLPTLPDSMQKDTLELIVPVQFLLR